MANQNVTITNVEKDSENLKKKKKKNDTIADGKK